MIVGGWKMTKPRQDSWTKDEDILLAEIVLRYIRNGKTQLEAFKEAAKELSRTAAACGFRWNATIRKQHLEAIHLAKQNRKQTKSTQITTNPDEEVTLETAILLLEKIKDNVTINHTAQPQHEQIQHLIMENDRLEQELTRYKEAWTEMKHLWDWIEKNEH